MSDHKSSFFRPLLWAATLAIGFGTLWTLLAVWLFAAIDNIRQGAEGNANSYEQLVVTPDGTPLIQSTRWDNLSLSTYRDLSGRTREAPEESHLLPGMSMPGEHGKPGVFADQPGWEHRLKYFVNEQEPTVVWYFVHDGKPEGAGYFVGYERVSNRRVGFIGLLGFRSDPVPVDEWIPVRNPLILDYSYWSSAPVWIYWGSGRGLQQFRPTQWDLPPRLVHVPSGNRLRLVDLATRTVNTVFEAPEPIEALAIPVLSSYARGRPATEQPILVRTGRQIQTLNRKYQITRVFNIPTEADRWSPVSWYEIGNGQALAEFDRPGVTRRAFSIAPRTLYRIASDGTIQDQFEVVLRSGTLALSEEMGSSLLALTLPAPVILIVIQPLFRMIVDPAQSYPAAVSGMLRSSWPSLSVVLVLTLVLAVMAKRRSRAFGLSKREQFAWAVFVFLLGLPAYVGFLLYRRWPIRQPCPNCHARVPRDRAACAECGTRFPDPSHKGIEIFA